VDEKMTHSQYRHFPGRVEKGAKVVVLPAGDHERMGCFTDQVKLTHVLVRDLDEAVKEINNEGHVEMIPEREAPVPHEVILADAEPEMP
jgi:hypothetical protein